MNGYFVGSECYIPAKNYITSVSGTSFDYAFERQWMFYKNWGRLLYDPGESDQVFINAFEERYPGSGTLLFENQKLVSRIPLIIASYWNATWDNTLYSEGFLSIMGRDSVRLISLDDMRKKKPMDPDFISIRQYLDGEGTADPEKITPMELADSMEVFCTRALSAIAEVEVNDDPDLLCEVSDIQAWAHLGLYFSSKLRAAAEYQKYLDSGEQEYLNNSIAELEDATTSWKKLSEVTGRIYDPMPMQHYERNGDVPFHWSVVEEEVEEELAWLKSQY